MCCRLRTCDHDAKEDQSITDWQISKRGRGEEGKVEGIKDERAVVVDTGQEVVDRDRVLRDSINPSPRRKTGGERKEERNRCAAGPTAKIHYAYPYALAHCCGKLKDNESDQRVFA